MNHLDKRIDELYKKIDTLQYQTDDALHDIDVVNKNIRNYYGLLRRTEDEKIDAEPNLERLWHDVSEEPQGTYIVLCDGLDNMKWVVDYLHIDMSYANWKDYADAIKVNRWAYIRDLLPKGGEQ